MVYPTMLNDCLDRIYDIRFASTIHVDGINTISFVTWCDHLLGFHNYSYSLGISGVYDTANCHFQEFLRWKSLYFCDSKHSCLP